MSHEIEWKLEHGTVAARLECSDEDCIHRYGCVHSCEVVWDVQRADDETVSHGPSGYDEDDIGRHEMTRGDDCNFMLFLNEDTYLIPELFDGKELVIARTHVDPVWQGEDGALWKPAEATS